MRAVFVGAGSLTRHAATLLARRGHEVVVVERAKEVIEALKGQLDCGFLLGDGTRPHVLKEADPQHCDVLLCLAGDDQTNIIAALVGRSLGFPRVVTRINEEEFEHICVELDLQDTIIPSRTIGRFLADMVEGHDFLELSAAIKGDARVFVFAAKESEEGRVDALGLPGEARVTHLYRNGKLIFAEPDTRIEAGDELVVLARREHVGELRELLGGHES